MLNLRRNERNIRNRNKIRKKYERETQDKKTISVLSKSVIILFVIFVVIAVSFGIYNYFSNKNFLDSLRSESLETSADTKEDTKKEEEPTDITFSLAAIGDIMCHNTQYQDALNSDTNEYDFSYVFDDIEIYTKVSDLCVGNLETTFAGKEKGYSSYPTFNTPDNLAFNLKKLGLDVLTTANNHSLDTGTARTY